MLVEGWKTENYPKLEVWRPVGEHKPPRFPRPLLLSPSPARQSWIPAAYGRGDLPALPLNDVDAIADFIIQALRAADSATLC